MEFRYVPLISDVVQTSREVKHRFSNRIRILFPISNHAIFAFAMFDEVLIAGYFLNGLLILYVQFANLAPPWRHLYGQDDW